MVLRKLLLGKVVQLIVLVPKIELGTSRVRCAGQKVRQVVYKISVMSKTILYRLWLC